MIHIFKMDDMHFALDTSSGLVHVVDEIIYDLLTDENFKNEDKVNEIKNKYGNETTAEAVSEINYLIQHRMLYTDDANAANKIKPAIKAMCLNMTHDCNLRCEYCFASQGSYNGERSYL
ncbi:MAG: Radical domain protein, partial [Sedimentibacter sp.]|nr:Radical domain protein [Sedimentibacter sp.]